jgi:hypothetical protein
MNEITDTDGVRWREVPGFPGYRVSEDGRVQSRKRRGSERLWDEWVEKALVNAHSGHKLVGLNRGRKKITRTVHSLVLEAFVGPRPPGAVCRHFPDRDPANNRLENLQWGTSEENTDDRDCHGTTAVGKRNGKAQLDAEAVTEIRRLAANGLSSRKIAERFGMSHTAIIQIRRGRTWRHVPQPTFS